MPTSSLCRSHCSSLQGVVKSRSYLRFPVDRSGRRGDFSHAGTIHPLLLFRNNDIGGDMIRSTIDQNEHRGHRSTHKSKADTPNAYGQYRVGNKGK
jgi:hypothetical protein